ncbi:MAG: BMP family ABC transporter substrate-binding protein [Candidatus Dormibacter sp.]
MALVLQPAPTRRPVAIASPSRPTPCARIVRVGFVTDVAQLSSGVDADGWAGVQAAATVNSCLRTQLLRSARPEDYVANLDVLAAHHDLVVAGSFLLTDAVASAARTHPSVHFALVDPLVAPAPQPNLAVIRFREDQAAFLAGALAAMVSHTGVIGGVYGLEGGAMTRYRRGFEQGVAAVDPSMRVLGAYQPASEGPPFGNLPWGRLQAGRWLAVGADVIFGAGGTTGEGALMAAAEAHQLCIGAGTDLYRIDPPARSCLVTSAISRVDRAVELELLEAGAGRWTAGERAFGLAEEAAGLAPFHQLDARVTPDIRLRLDALAVELAAGRLLDGN